MQAPEKSQYGFTLLEAMVGTALFGILMIGVFTMYASNTNVFNRGLSAAESHQNARTALDQMTRELRMAGFDLSGVMDGLPVPNPIQGARSNRITFVADVDRDGTLDQVIYRLVQGTMIREFTSWSGTSFPAPTSSELASGLSSVTFEYFDDAQPTNNSIAAPVATSDLDDIHRVRLSLTASARTGREGGDFPLFVDVKLRN